MGNSAFLNLEPGTRALLAGQEVEIRHVLDLETLLVFDPKSAETKQVKVSQISPLTPLDDKAALADVSQISERRMEVAEERYQAIAPLVDRPERSRSEVEARAEEVGVHPATLYRWLSDYEGNGLKSALAPSETTGGRGKSRLDEAVEKIIQATIKDTYKTTQKQSVAKTVKQVRKRCKNANLPPPAANTVRSRIQAISPQELVRSREGARAAKERFAPAPGHFPHALKPLAVAEIDHTPVDAMIVDEEERLPINRPWLTVAIDVFSRMILGFYVTLDPPSASSTGLCLIRCFLPKEEWLARKGVDVEWPVWGVVETIHADNDRGFRGLMLQRACRDYGCNLEWRPVKTPEYGGHIESLCGTLNEKIHGLRGTTFSNPKQKGRYRSDKKAVYTLSELEAQIIRLINEYHHEDHSALDTTPIKRYEEGIFHGFNGVPPRGLPPRVSDEDRLRLNFTPCKYRSVQRYGIVIDGVQYYADVLRPWINARDPKNPNKKRKFLIRRDPRNISVVWFLDPDLDQYFAIPYRNLANPAISIWELREARLRLKEQKRDASDEQEIFRMVDEIRHHEEQAVKKTRAARARRNKERRRHHGKAKLPATPKPSGFKPEDENEVAPDFSATFPEEIESFDDLEGHKNG